ncbi:hypothetical protein NAEGRDRAFT_57333 [Naegleria gruberi]|uniref:Uncharacterized protein n=1 Tax=Naegleria gruberi TaxID=5762 RepID=D2V6Z0_NAEGR|nr:uncharacterized protein NAEGRDRAFT_57333 [Naegleria gruberi]EFC47651.1 hypothetical protein NAEGRDRAFT_57333 [Naegleria gruberi]|eukprot:XP_002680395.1 hypothetical protein NAEGRDRAFT_57333 [Naegleria gruberi strain NEG-M]
MGWFDGIPGLSQMEAGWHQYHKIRGDVTVINESDLTLECYNNHAYQVDFWGGLNRTIHPGASFDCHIEFYAFMDTNKGDTAAESDYNVFFEGQCWGQLNIYARDGFIGTKSATTPAYKLGSEPFVNLYRSNERTVIKIFNGDGIKEIMNKRFTDKIEGLQNELIRVTELIVKNQGAVADLLKQQEELKKQISATITAKSKYTN